MRINVKAFALACGLIWGVGVLSLTWWVIAFEGPTHDTMLLGHLYRGFNISPSGSVIGLLWGFADGLIGGAVFAWLYNTIAKSAMSTSSVKTEVEHIAAASHW